MIKELLHFFNPSDHLGIWLLVSFVIAFVVSFSTFPAIFHVSEAKHLMDEPGERSIHSVKTPTLGGVGIFISLVVVITTIGGLLETKTLLLILGSLTILFFLGLKDDLLILSPTKKLFGQFLAAMVLIAFTDTRILGFSGLLGITIMPYWLSVAFTLFVYLLVINAYNLIDGVDGLAGSLALLGAGAFAFMSIKTGDITMATIAVATVGSLIPFLRLNFSKNQKIFMGDTGSMIIGFLLAFFAVRFINQSQLNQGAIFFNSAPIMILSILFFPLLDTLRIFFIRLVILKKSPFSADKNHLHHKFLDLGFTHIQTTTYIVLLNLMLIAFAYSTRELDIFLQFILLMVVGISLYSTLFIYNWIMLKGWFPQFLKTIKNYKL
ncbi:MraY family glycosyltransferase [Sediminibacter sp. Hel_I_10]|uniref:MraY family glycosyltransferase n=1 Tax=Sediminibacter sp. Hel_I_10 TaxID=1392490 RepID=UPI00068FD212|nr:MraY family glycosyltransferase [Sediminibacter sp. Hel_I_10]